MKHDQLDITLEPRRVVCAPHAAVGATLRARRVGAGLTLRRCAQHLGISMTHLSRIERGELQMTASERIAFDAATRSKE